MDLNALRDANFSTFGDAVTDWQHMARKLKELQEDAEKDLTRKAEKANWSGVNSKVTRDFVKKTANEFADAHTEAQTIANILSDTKNELVTYHRQLVAAIEQAARKNVKVTDTGHGTFTVSDSTPPPVNSGKGDGEVRSNHPESLEGIRNDIQHILSKATEVDKTARDVLKALVDSTKYGFSDASYSDRDHAAQALKDAEKAARMARNPESMSENDIKTLNAYLKKHHDDPLFAEQFVTKLGAKRTLEFWHYMVTVPPSMSDATEKLRTQLQDNLSMTLATASSGDTVAVDNWKKGIISLGSHRFAGPSDPSGSYGFQLMSSLMKKGEYNTAFLDDYGKTLIKFERGTSPSASVCWGQTGSTDLRSKDPINDPVSGFMEALGHNPQASAEFFTESTTENGEKISNFNYLTGDVHGARVWPGTEEKHWWGTKDHNMESGFRSLGHALESATLGVPYDSGKAPLPHTATGSALFREIVQKFGNDTGRLEGPASGLTESLGNITAGYMRDVDNAFSPSQSIHVSGVKAVLMDTGKGGDPGNDMATLKAFLKTLGKDPSAYAAITTAQQTVTTDQINDAYHHSDMYKDFSSHLANTVRPGAQIAGIMADSRADAVTDGKIASDAEYNSKVEKADKWVGYVIDKGIEKIPVGGDAASSVAEKIRETVVSHYSVDHSADIAKGHDAYLESQKWASVGATYSAARTAALQSGVDETNASDQADTAAYAVMEMYGLGQDSAEWNQIKQGGSS